jgi:hypothetical protein
MSDYKIKAGNVTFGKIGETVTEKDLNKLGVNIDALVEGGHLAASRATSKKDDN